MRLSILLAYLLPQSIAWTVGHVTHRPLTRLASSLSLESILSEHTYDRRLIELDQFPILGEVWVNGQANVARIHSCIDSRFEIELLSDGQSQTIDVGQVTTLWSTDGRLDGVPATKLPLAVVESAMDRLYSSRVGRSRSKGLTKKQLARILDDFGADDRSPAEMVLRQVIKAGVGQSRLIDSQMACEYLFPEASDLESRARAAEILGADAEHGGRFKRFPCVVVSTSPMKLINGGWLVVDQSVRASTEARKFANDSSDRPPTKADLRIIRRLECLAMGEASGDLELDVRETLVNMDLDISPEGARQALVRIGRWSEQTTMSRLEPWPKEIVRSMQVCQQRDTQSHFFTRQLDAASWYVDKRALGWVDEGRVDLTNLPCLCIDAKRTTFRDDAISIRPRAATGRYIKDEASKWEVLIHIADVSDIYSSQVPDELNDGLHHLASLKEAAQSRGMSRYDLPLGPLHLLPPRILSALAFSNDGTDNRCVTLWAFIDERTGHLLDAGVERSLVRPPKQLSFAQATELLEGRINAGVRSKERAILLVLERILDRWSTWRRQQSDVARRREARLVDRERRSQSAQFTSIADDGHNGFQRSRAHQLVDMSLDLYGSALYSLLRRQKAPIPAATGADLSKGARVATAPLRRYIDGEAQRQALSVLCDYGETMTSSDCRIAGKLANQARNSNANNRAQKRQPR